MIVGDRARCIHEQDRAQPPVDGRARMTLRREVRGGNTQVLDVRLAPRVLHHCALEAASFRIDRSERVAPPVQREAVWHEKGTLDRAVGGEDERSAAHGQPTGGSFGPGGAVGPSVRAGTTLPSRALKRKAPTSPTSIRHRSRWYALSLASTTFCALVAGSRAPVRARATAAPRCAGPPRAADRSRLRTRDANGQVKHEFSALRVASAPIGRYALLASVTAVFGNLNSELAVVQITAPIE